MDPLGDFYLALFNGDVDRAHDMLKCGFDPNQRTPTGGTPLISACTLPKVDPFLKMMVDCGADLEMKHEANGQTALIVVAQSGLGKRVKLLLKLGANPNAVDDFGQTPLFVAMALNQKKYVTVVKELLAGGADPDGAGARSPLIAAAECGHAGCVGALVSAGADINTVHDSGTALIKAILGRRHENLQLLLQAGADPLLSVPVDCDHPQIAGRNAFEIADLLGDAKARSLLEADKQDR